METPTIVVLSAEEILLALSQYITSELQKRLGNENRTWKVVQLPEPIRAPKGVSLEMREVP